MVGMSDFAWKAYEKIDGALMYGANKAVHAWNWTTGGTKLGLANKLISVATIAECVGSFSPVFNDRNEKNNLALGIIFALIFLILNHIIQYDYQINHEKENSALEKRCLDKDAEKFKEAISYSGPFVGVVGMVGMSNSSPQANLYGTGFVLTSASTYIMRSDSLPPRKDCIRRGIDKLSEMVQNYRYSEPALA